MTEEEKQAKLAEMMANADWRDEQRTTRVMKHRREQEILWLKVPVHNAQ